jgi:hemerythrin superfamily protein
MPSTTLPDQKRLAIAEKLAGMKAVQNLIIANEQQFLQETNDSEIKERFSKMLEDDRKNLGIIETVITQYGLQSQPEEELKEMIQHTQKAMKGSDLSFYQKVLKHELLKHGTVVSGLVVHKAAQVAGADVQLALAPLNAVNFENRAHQEQLKGMLEVLGTRELTGLEPEDGVWARVKDTIAALSGIAGSAVTQASDKSDLNVQDVIRADHQKVNTLIAEIERCNDAHKVQEYFTQLATDLLVHSKAEEEIVYPAVRPFYGEHNTQELYEEQAELAAVLEQMKSLNPSSSEFKAELNRVKAMVGDHTRQEESTMFATIRDNFSSQQSEQLATEFKKAKQHLQTQMQAGKHSN